MPIRRVNEQGTGQGPRFPSSFHHGFVAGRPTSRRRPVAATTHFRSEISMAKEEPIQLDGTVTEVLPNATFRVRLSNGHDMLATLAGQMRRFRIRVLAGDRVTLEASPYDLSRGRITFRHKS